MMPKPDDIAVWCSLIPPEKLLISPHFPSFRSRNSSRRSLLHSSRLKIGGVHCFHSGYESCWGEGRHKVEAVRDYRSYNGDCNDSLKQSIGRGASLGH
jgi:hypothetical protein